MDKELLPKRLYFAVVSLSGEKKYASIPLTGNLESDKVLLFEILKDSYRFSDLEIKK